MQGKEIVRSVADIGKFPCPMLLIFLLVLQGVVKSRTLVIHCCTVQLAPFATLSKQRESSHVAQ